MILKPSPEMPEQAHRPGNGSSILIRQSSKQSHNEAIIAPNMNFHLEIISIYLMINFIVLQ